MSILQMDTARLWSSTNLAKILGLVRGRTRIQPGSQPPRAGGKHEEWGAGEGL